MNKADWLFQMKGDTRGIMRELAKGVNTSIFPGENVMLSVVRVDPHATGSIHSHPEEQWGILLEGKCTRIQGGKEVDAVAGEFWHTPGGVEHGVRTGAEGALIIDIFSPPRAEYRQSGKGFGKAEIKSS